MTGCAPRTLLLGFVLTLLACGSSERVPLSNGAAGQDGGGAAGQGGGAAGSMAGAVGSGTGGGGSSVAPADGTCSGEPIGCVQGMPLGTGVACGGLVTLANCFEGHWECGSMIPQSSCTCGEPGLGCPGVLCTANGWVCPDGGTDADASRDALANGLDAGTANDGASSCQPPAPSCDLGYPLDTGVFCAGYDYEARCLVGAEGAFYDCPEGSIPRSTCTCIAPKPTCAGVHCTVNGWVCPSGGA
jgi:hypothetical protein